MKMKDQATLQSDTGFTVSSTNKADRHHITESGDKHLKHNRNYSAILATLQITSYALGV